MRAMRVLLLVLLVAALLVVACDFTFLGIP
jgi:hypothetical protein